MSLINFIAVCLLLSSVFVHSAQPSWLVKPSVCVTNNVGARCQFEIQVLPVNLPEGTYCLFLRQQPLRCLKLNQFPVTLTVELSGPGELSLKNAQGKMLLVQPLSVKSLKSNLQRRRLRSPWSLF